MGERLYFVYILTNKHETTLYTGITNDLHRRLLEDRYGSGSKFTKKYNISKLVYFEIIGDVWAAIEREKQIKGGSRQNKIELINGLNPNWKDLFEEMED